MGLDQNLYAVSFSETEDFPTRFFAKEYQTEDEQFLFEMNELAYFRKNNLLQGYFERKYNIDNCEYVRVSDEDLDYLISTCNKFLSYFTKEFIQEVQDYFDLSLKEYVKKYKKHDSNVTIDRSYARKIMTEIEAYLNQRFKETLSKNKECHEIITEELPITEGFFYGVYELNIDYLISIFEIKEAFEDVEYYLLNSDDGEVYYHCWY